MSITNKEKFRIIGVQENANFEQINLKNISYFESVKIKLKSNKVALVILIAFIILIITIIIGPTITKYNTDGVNARLKNFSPSIQHFFGTDEFGRDIFTRVCVASRISLFIGLVVAFVNLTIGTMYGAICAYYGGIADDIIMRIIEIIATIPNLLLIILFSLFLGNGIISLIVSMCIVGWCNITRIIRGQLLVVREQEYILAAQALGADASRIIVKHMLRNIIPIMIVTFTLEVPAVILNETILCYMGIGLQETKLSLGILMKNYVVMGLFYPYQLFLPSLVIIIILISLNVLGDCLRDALDPKII